MDDAPPAKTTTYCFPPTPYETSSASMPAAVFQPQNRLPIDALYAASPW